MYGFAKLLRQGKTFAGKTIRLGADVDLSSYAWDTRGSGSDHRIGGIAGENYDRQSRVYNCVNAGSVTGSNGYRGAIVGRNNEDDGYVEQGYYLRYSAPGRKGTGTESDAEDDDAKHVECSAFSSFAGNPDRVVEDGCSGKNLCDALNHWVERCGTEYSRWQWYNGVLVPGAAQEL